MDLKQVISGLLLIAVLSNANAKTSNGTGTIIPLYLYPEVINGVHNWDPVIKAHKAHPIDVWAIVNVYNGPSTEIDPGYVDAINRLKAAGIHTLGYVYTNYTRRSTAAVEKDIDTWKAYYNPEGIFFDEMTSDNNNVHIKYYKDLGVYTKGKGYTYTVGNPGIGVPMTYVGTLDTIMIYETDTGFPSQNQICKNYQNYPRQQWGIFPYNIPKLNAKQILDAKKCVGFIYVTNDGGDNPWDELPPYLDQLFELLQRPI